MAKQTKSVIAARAGLIPASDWEPQPGEPITFDTEELATVLAALRLFQREYEDFSGDAIREAWPDHFEGIEPLGTDDIDTLCERINQ